LTALLYNIITDQPSCVFACVGSLTQILFDFALSESLCFWCFFVSFNNLCVYFLVSFQMFFVVCFLLSVCGRLYFVHNIILIKLIRIFNQVFGFLTSNNNGNKYGKRHGKATYYYGSGNIGLNKKNAMKMQNTMCFFVCFC